MHLKMSRLSLVFLMVILVTGVMFPCQCPDCDQELDDSYKRGGVASDLLFDIMCSGSSRDCSVLISEVS